MTKGRQFLLLETSLTASRPESQCPQLSEELFTVGNPLLSQLHPLANLVRSSKARRTNKKKTQPLRTTLHYIRQCTKTPERQQPKTKKTQSYLQGTTPPKKSTRRDRRANQSNRRNQCKHKCGARGVYKPCTSHEPTNSPNRHIATKQNTRTHTNKTAIVPTTTTTQAQQLRKLDPYPNPNPNLPPPKQNQKKKHSPIQLPTTTSTRTSFAQPAPELLTHTSFSAPWTKFSYRSLFLLLSSGSSSRAFQTASKPLSWWC